MLRILLKVLASVVFALALMYNLSNMKAVKKKQSTKKKYLIIVTAAILLAVVMSVVVSYSIRSVKNAPRLDRINTIYDSLNLGSEYKLKNSSVFGDKRLYKWDSGRSYSSSKIYERDVDVDVAVEEMKKSIEGAGFHFFDEPYAGSTYTQLHFKSSLNEYIRLTVSSKPRDEAFAGNKSPSQDDYALDPNSGPSNVLIKVNLDDNNE